MQGGKLPFKTFSTSQKTTGGDGAYLSNSYVCKIQDQIKGKTEPDLWNGRNPAGDFSGTLHIDRCLSEILSELCLTRIRHLGGRVWKHICDT